MITWPWWAKRWLALHLVIGLVIVASTLPAPVAWGLTPQQCAELQSTMQRTRAAASHAPRDQQSFILQALRGYEQTYNQYCSSASTGQPPSSGSVLEKTKQEDLEQAKAHWNRGTSLFQQRQYDKAGTEFSVAAVKYRHAGDARAEGLAEREATRCLCYGSATEAWQEAARLRYLSDGWPCGDFAEMLKRIADRLDQLAAAAAPKPEPEKHVVYLVATESGRFFGTAKGKGSLALATAETLCFRLKANTATTPEERNEACYKTILSTDGCVALARSHDMFWNAPDKYYVGLGSAKPAAAASQKALDECKRAGGANCFVVPESVQCVSGGKS